MKKRTLLSWLLAGTMFATQVPQVLAASPSIPGFAQPSQTPQTITQSAYELVSEQGYRIPNTSIESYTNNGGQYASSALQYAFDDNPDTHWETGKPNSANHINTVTVTFKTPVTPNRIEYMCRHDGTQPKGSPTKYKLLASTAATGENFTVLTTGSFPVPYSNAISIDFPATTMKRFRFEFTACHEDWASMSELRFYKAESGPSQDSILDSVFTDQTYSQLKSGVSAATIDKQIAQANTTLSGVVKEKAVEILQEGKRLAKDPQVFEPLTFTLSQRGNMEAEKVRTRMPLGLHSFDATGYYISPNETISVYADFDRNGPAPVVVLGQFGEIRGSSDNWAVNNWKKEYTLKPGVNIITAPSWAKIGPSAIYFNNDCSPAEQSRQPKVRLVGGTRFPLYVQGKTDPAAFRAELEAYLRNVVADGQEAANFDRAANNLTAKYYNICEAVSENTVLTSSATGCKRALDKNPPGKTMQDTMIAWEEMYDLFTELSGYNVTDVNSPTYKPAGKYICRVFWVKNPGVGAYATNGYTAYNAGNNKKQTNNGYMDIFSYQNLTNGWGWGYYHEIGHQYDNIDTIRGEVTNNLFSLAAQDYFRPYPNKNRLDVNDGQSIWTKIKEGNRTGQHPMRLKANNPEPTNQDGDNVWYQLAEIYQLFMAYDAESREKTGHRLYAAMCNVFYENPGLFPRNNNRTTAVENMALAMSLALGKDITAHFENYKHVISAAAKQRTGVDRLPKETAKTWYADSVMRDPASAGFANPAAMPIVGSKGSGASFKLTLQMNEAPNTLLCYEVWQGNTLLGVTYGNEFAISNGNNATSYKVIAYDRRCRPSLAWEGTTGNNPNAAAQQDNAAIAVAKTAVENAVYTVAQQNAGSAQQAKATVEAVIGTLNLNGVAAVVTEVAFTPAVSGTQANASGTDGNYTFTVTLHKGYGTPSTTAQLTMNITAEKVFSGGFPVKVRLIAPDDANKYAAWFTGTEDGTGLKKLGDWIEPSLEQMEMTFTEPGAYYAYLTYTTKHYILSDYTKFARFIVDENAKITSTGVYTSRESGAITPTVINVNAPIAEMAPYLSHNNGADTTLVTFGYSTDGRGDIAGQASVAPQPAPEQPSQPEQPAQPATPPQSDIPSTPGNIEPPIADIPSTPNTPSTPGNIAPPVTPSEPVVNPEPPADNAVTFPISISAAKVESTLTYGTWLKGNLKTPFAPCTWKGDSRSGMPLLYTSAMSITEPGVYYLALASNKRWAYDASCKIIEVTVSEDGSIAVQGYNMVGSSLNGKNDSARLSRNPANPTAWVVSWGGIPEGNI